LISKKFEKEIVFESSVSAWIRNRIEQNAGSRSVINQSGSTTLKKTIIKFDLLDSGYVLKISGASLVLSITISAV
jgi:hypothetical protein